VKSTMRAPIRSETDAFWVAIGGALVVFASLLTGWLTEPVIGLVVFVIAIVVAVVAYLVVGGRDRFPSLRIAASEPHAHGAAPDQRHVLVIANEALSGAELRELIVGRNGERVELDVLAPVLTSRVPFEFSDIDRGLADARERLERSLAWAREQGLAARGEVGDPSTTTAIEDELRDFGADEVIVVTHPRGLETWQERGELDRLQTELNVPIRHVVVGTP